jgi:hypothetical protein
MYISAKIADVGAPMARPSVYSISDCVGNNFVPVLCSLVV